MSSRRDGSNAFSALDFRMRRVMSAFDNRTLIVPLDHATTAGPVGALAHPSSIVEAAVAGGADAVMLRPSLMHALDVPGSENLGVIMALTGRLTQGVDHVVLNTVENGIANGADAICGEFKFGSTGDLENARVIAELAERAHQLGMPVLVTVYALPNITEERGPGAYAHGCRIAEEIGADFIKTSLPDDVDVIAECADVTSVPIVLAGGDPRSQDDLEDFLRRAVKNGMSGAAIGRNAWMSGRPADNIRRLAGAVHSDTASGPAPGASAVTPVAGAGSYPY